MQELSHRNLEQLAEDDPVSRPVARLQLESLRSASDPVWEISASSIPDDFPDPPAPAIHQRSIPVDRPAIASLLIRLAGVIETTDDIGVAYGPLDIDSVEPLALLAASIQWDSETLSRISDASGIDFSILATLGNYAALPVLHSCGRAFPRADIDFAWEPGYCPVCGAWPMLAERRGLDRQQWLRCGRCSAAWRSRHQRCVFCDTTDHKKLGYMAPEEERESRRALTCDVCHGYLKAFTTVSPFSIADILHTDLASIELDIAAMEAGYSRPERPGFAPNVELVPVDESRGRWLPWR